MHPYTLFVLLLSTLHNLCSATLDISLNSGGHQEQARLGDDVELSLIEYAPGQTRWITEDQRWALKREGLQFFDITHTPHLGQDIQTDSVVIFPNHTVHGKTLRPLLHGIETINMRKNLEAFTSFHTRYYKSASGAESSRWLFDLVNQTLANAGAHKYNATIRRFEHPWGQHSIIASLPGRSNNTIVIGAHQDSVNLYFPALFAAPGADDDGSGTVTILEALRVLLSDSDVLKGNRENTLEFHWYSAEEGGLLGSQAVFQSYVQQGRQVKAMLHQDMTGYIQGMIDAGKPVTLGVINDFVHPGLTAFIKKVINDYCDISYADTECGYACSDHASAARAGYPSAFVVESEFKDSNLGRMHTTDDVISALSFEHMKQHAKLTIGAAYELAFARF